MKRRTHDRFPLQDDVLLKGTLTVVVRGSGSNGVATVESGVL